MSDLAEFLLARIAEDEAAVREGLEPDFLGEKPSYYSSFGAHRDDWGLWTFNVPTARVLAECDAKRQIVAEAQHAWATAIDPSEPEGNDWRLGRRWGWREALRFLALPYADHLDYRDEWKL